ncbi:hypothetical protein Tco_0589112 [Tanacetum coccineum]
MVTPIHIKQDNASGNEKRVMKWKKMKEEMNIRLLTCYKQYEKFSIPEDESIDIGFAKFNNVVTNFNELDESFSSKNYVRKSLRALHPKWRANVTAIEESKDLSSLFLEKLSGNLKVHEMIMEKDFELVRGKREKIKSLVLKAKKESSDDET